MFVTKLNTTGSALVYSTFLGGSGFDSAGGLALDAAGNAYVSGGAASVDFPTTPGAFDTLPDGSDAFVTKLNPAGSALVYSTVLGGTGSEGASAVAVDARGSVASGAASYTIQIDDSSAFSAPLVREQQNITTLLMYATTGLATTQHFWRVRGVNAVGIVGPWSAVRSFTPGAAPPPATLGSLDTNPSTVVGGNPSSGTVVLSVGAPFGGALIALSSSNPAVASVPPTVLAAGQQLHRDVHDHDLTGGGQHNGHRDRRLQRHDKNRGAHGYAIGARPTGGESAGPDAQPDERRGRFDVARHGRVVGQCPATWRGRFALEQCWRCERPRQCHGESGSHNRDVHRVDDRCQRINSGHDLGDL